MKIYKKHSKVRGCHEYSITRLTPVEFELLACVMANLRLGAPIEAHVGRFTVHYDGYDTLAPAFCGYVAQNFRDLFAVYGRINVPSHVVEPQIKFDIDDVL